MVKQPVNQHYVPRFLLRNFTFGEKDQVHVFDKLKDRIFIANIANIAVERQFNEYDSNGDKVSIEAQLERIESHCAPIVQRIIDEQAISGLSLEDKAAISLFVAVQSTRTNHLRNLSRQIDHVVIHAIRALGGDPSKTEGYTPISDENEVKQFSIQNVLRAHELLPYILNKDWLLLSTSESDPFYISDHPVALQNFRSRGTKGNIGFGVEGIEIYMPLSKTLTLALICPTYKREISELYHIYHQATELGKTIGIPQLLSPHEFDPRIGYLFEGLTSGNTLRCSREITINLNHLQVVFSSRFLFASSEDFSLVSNLLRQNPELRLGVQIIT